MNKNTYKIKIKSEKKQHIFKISLNENRLIFQKKQTRRFLNNNSIVSRNFWPKPRRGRMMNGED